MRQWFRNLPINRKLTAVILLTCAAALALAGAAMITTESVSDRRALLDDTIVLADLMARNNSASLAFHRDEDAEEADRELAALHAHPQILAARLYDEAGHLFAGYARPDVPAVELPVVAP